MGRQFVLVMMAGVLWLVGCRAKPTPTPAFSPPAATFTTEPAVVARQVATATPTMLPAPAILGQVTLRPLAGIGHGPAALAIVDERVYVANRGTDNLSVIVEDQVVATIPVGHKPVALAADGATGRLYVVNSGDGTLSVIAGDKVIGTVFVGREPSSVAVLGERVYIGLSSETTIRVLRQADLELLATVSLPDGIGVLSLAADPEARAVYASVYNRTFRLEAETLTLTLSPLKREESSVPTTAA